MVGTTDKWVVNGIAMCVSAQRHCNTTTSQASCTQSMHSSISHVFHAPSRLRRNLLQAQACLRPN